MNLLILLSSPSPLPGPLPPSPRPSPNAFPPLFPPATPPPSPFSPSPNPPPAEMDGYFLGTYRLMLFDDNLCFSSQTIILLIPDNHISHPRQSYFPPAETRERDGLPKVHPFSDQCCPAKSPLHLPQSNKIVNQWSE